MPTTTSPTIAYLAPPAADTGNGVLHGSCSVGHPNGTRTEYEEGVDIDQTKLNGGSTAYATTDGGVKSIDPNKLIRDPFNGCKPVYPWNFIRANTVFGVIHRAGGYTAWSDKHAVYAAVSGPTGTSTPSNVDDYYSPEVNSNSIALPGVKTATGLDCSKLPNNNGGDWTTDFDNIKCYDQLKVNAVVNWIHGKSHLGTGTAPVPAIFGMNFQAVSVGQKLIEKGVFGGYQDAAGTPTPSMLGEIRVRRWRHRSVRQRPEAGRTCSTRPRSSLPPSMGNRRSTLTASSRSRAAAAPTAPRRQLFSARTSCRTRS